MRKKITALLCVLATLSVLLPQSVIFAKNDVAAEETTALLNALNVNPGESVTQSSLINAMAGFLYEKPQAAGSAEQIARSLGLIEEDEEFKPTSTVSREVALKYAVIILGYRAKAEQYGGFPTGYNKLANELDLTNGLPPKANDKLNQDAAASLICSMIDADPMGVYISTDGNWGYAVQEGGSLLSANRDIEKIYGVLTATPDTSIYGEKGSYEGTIAIDEVEYLADGDYEHLLGKNVVAYAKVKNDEATIIYVGERVAKNTTMEIVDEDIIKVSDNFLTIEYENENDDVKKIKLSYTPRVIYNGVYLKNYTTADLKPENGSIRLVDNDGDKMYDVIFVTSYQTMVVDSVLAEEYIITNKYNYTNALANLTLKVGSDIVNHEIYKGGELVTINDIRAGDILLVAQSKNAGDKRVTIIVSDKENITAKITSVNTAKGLIGINGTMYKKSKDFDKQLTADGKTLKLEEEYTFKFDANGEISFVVAVQKDTYKLLLKVYEYEEKYYAVYMDTEGEWFTGELAKSVRIDGVKYADYVAYNEIKDYNAQVVKLETNEDGVVRYIDFAIETMDAMENEFTKTVKQGYEYRNATRSFDNIGADLDNIYLRGDFKMFIFPSDVSSKNKEDYDVISSTKLLKPEGQMNYISAYDIDEYGYTSIISINAGAQDLMEQYSENWFVVTEKGGMEYIDDEVCYTIKGQNGNLRNFTLNAKTPEVFDNVEIGNLIMYSIDREGYVLKTKVRYNPITGEIDPSVNEGDPREYTNGKEFAATVTKMDVENNRMKVMHDGRESTFRLDMGRLLVIYNTRTNETSTKQVASLRPGDKIYVKQLYGDASQIFGFTSR